MDTRDYQSVKQSLLSAAMVLSPTGQEQKAFVKIVHDLEIGEAMAHKEVLKQLLVGMLGGLLYGNWPGMSHKVSDIL